MWDIQLFFGGFIFENASWIEAYFYIILAEKKDYDNNKGSNFHYVFAFYNIQVCLEFKRVKVLSVSLGLKSYKALPVNKGLEFAIDDTNENIKSSALIRAVKG